MIITIKNTTRQGRVYQLDQRVSSTGYKGYSETVLRIDHDAQGNSQVRRKRLRHGPVLRISAREVREVPAAIMHDKVLNADTKGSRPKIKILRRETAEENTARKSAEAQAAADLQESRLAAQAARQQVGVRTSPETVFPDEKAGSEGTTIPRSKRGGKNKR